MYDRPLSAPAPQPPPVDGVKPDGKYEKRFLNDYNYTMTSGLFVRDFHNAIGRPGWFD